MSQAKSQANAGFTLVELLIALALTLLVGGAIVQALLASTALSQRLARQLRMQEFSQRARRLVESDLRRAEAVSADPASEPAACNWGAHAGAAAEPGSESSADHLLPGGGAERDLGWPGADALRTRLRDRRGPEP